MSNNVRRQGPLSGLFDAVTGAFRGVMAGDVETLLDTPAPYLGLVASRCCFPANFSTTNVQMMSRSRHVAMDNITSLQLVFTNNYLSATSEGVPTFTSTITASIEYPVGTITRITFGGVVTGTCAPAAYLISDAAAITIPRGATFFVRVYQNGGGIVFQQNSAVLSSNPGATGGDFATFGASGITDITGSSATTGNTQAGLGFRPVGIIGMTSRATFMACGDSRVQGSNISVFNQNAYGLTGEVDKSVGKYFATLNAGLPSETLANAITGFTARQFMAQFVSQIISNYGINDCIAGTAAATTVTNIGTFAAKFNGKPFYQCTLNPKSASTDGWATTTNQTTDATANPQRILVNNFIRTALAPPVSGYIEIADINESARDSGLWKGFYRQATDCSITSGQTLLNSTAQMQFTPADIGAPIAVAGAGAAGGVLLTTISSWNNSTQVALLNAAGTTVASAGTASIVRTVDGIHAGIPALRDIEASTAFNNLLTLAR